MSLGFELRSPEDDQLFQWIGFSIARCGTNLGQIMSISERGVVVGLLAILPIICCQIQFRGSSLKSTL